MWIEKQSSKKFDIKKQYDFRIEIQKKKLSERVRAPI